MIQLVLMKNHVVMLVGYDSDGDDDGMRVACESDCGQDCAMLVMMRSRSAVNASLDFSSSSKLK